MAGEPLDSADAGSVPQALCPSSTCHSGAILLGVVQADGSVGYLDHRRVVDDFFVKLAHEGRPPEKRFRFADTCVKGGCQQWGNGRCGVIDRVLAANAEYPGTGELPPCSIRSDCRWHLQWGARACGVCPLIVTDLRQDLPAVEEAFQAPDSILQTGHGITGSLRKAPCAGISPTPPNRLLRLTSTSFL